MERRIGELKFAVHEVFNLCSQTKRDFVKQKEKLETELAENIEGVSKKEVKEITGKFNFVKENEKKFTEECIRSVTTLTREMENIKKLSEDVDLKLTKNEIEFGTKILPPQNNI